MPIGYTTYNMHVYTLFQKKLYNNFEFILCEIYEKQIFILAMTQNTDIHVQYKNFKMRQCIYGQ